MEVSQRHLVFATWLGIIVNTFLAAIKGFVGIVAGSNALLADAVHSASDIISSVVVLFGIRIATKPPDEEHPYGHGKAENIASFIVALLLIIVGLQLALGAIQTFWGNPPPAPGSTALIVAIASIGIKEFLFQYKYRVGTRYSSTALIADAWHHRSDAFSSIAALFGIGGAIIGDRFGLPLLLYFDAIAGIVVSLIIVRLGYMLAKDSALVMMERVLEPRDVRHFVATTQGVEGVLGLDQIHARPHGHYVVLDVKISVDPSLSVAAGHEIARQVKQTLIRTHPEIHDVLIHLNPDRRNETPPKPRT